MANQDPCKLSVKAMAFACGVLWGLAVLLVSGANLIWPGYGDLFLDMVSSIYPGYDALPTLGSMAIGTVYAIVDGLIGGFIFALLYNLCAACKCGQKQPQ